MRQNGKELKIVLYSAAWKSYLERLMVSLKPAIADHHSPTENSHYFILRGTKGEQARVVVLGFSPADKDRLPNDFQVLWCWNFPEDVLHEASLLEWVQTTSAGVEPFLKPDLLPDHVVLTQAKGFHGGPMAEYVLGALLGHYHGLFDNVLANKQHQMKKKIPELLSGKTMGIVGTGSIGQEIARLGHCFGMKIKGMKKRSGELPPHFDNAYTIAEKEAFCQDVSILVIAAPLTEETSGMINHDFLALLELGLVLINVGRGEIIVEPDLIAALRSGRVSYAILDVWSGEKPSPLLYSVDNLLMTPHFSGFFREYADAAARIFSENLIRYISEEPLCFRIDRQRGY